MSSIVDQLIDWIEIDSTTGREGDYGDALARELERCGFAVERQQLAEGRFNLLARAGEPRVVLCTHLDTVPPFIRSSVDADFVHGRGSCDAKGQAVAMVAAARELLNSSGEDRVGLLFTVGEEIDSAGAILANEHLSDSWKPAYTIIGEPTCGTFVRASKGIFKARLVARGVAGHSSQDIGPSAVHELVCCAHGILEAGWGVHPVLGGGTVNLGQIEGGVAPNVVADSARAELLIRSVEEPEVVEQRLRGLMNENVTLEITAPAYPPVEFHVPAGRAADTVAFGTDAPHLGRWGKPLLFGVGAILDAHTDHERVGVRDLDTARNVHVETVRGLLAELDAGTNA